MRVSLIGVAALSCEQGIIVICPECAGLCTLGRSAYNNGTLNCGCVPDREDPRSDCIFCKNPREPIATRFVYDDEVRHHSLRYVGFCNRHPCKWMCKYDRILRLSYIRNRYETRAFSVRLLDGTRIDVVPPYDPSNPRTFPRTTQRQDEN